MNQPRSLILFCLLLVGAVFVARLLASENKAPAGFEYVTIRWAGKENTHIIRPGGQVEFIGLELRKVTRPDRTDERAFYMNAVMNGLTKEGYEFAGMSTDEIIMRRSLSR